MTTSLSLHRAVRYKTTNMISQTCGHLIVDVIHAQGRTYKLCVTHISVGEFFPLEGGILPPLRGEFFHP